MRIANIDWTSDGTVFLLTLIVTFVILAVALERLSPRRQTRRRLNDRTTNRDLID